MSPETKTWAIAVLKKAAWLATDVAFLWATLTLVLEVLGYQIVSK